MTSEANETQCDHLLGYEDGYEPRLLYARDIGEVDYRDLVFNYCPLCGIPLSGKETIE